MGRFKPFYCKWETFSSIAISQKKRSFIVRIAGYFKKENFSFSAISQKSDRLLFIHLGVTMTTMATMATMTDNVLVQYCITCTILYNMPHGRPTPGRRACQGPAVVPTSQATTVRLNWNLPVQAAFGRPPPAAAAGRPTAAGPSDPLRLAPGPWPHWQGKSETQTATQ